MQFHVGTDARCQPAKDLQQQLFTQHDRRVGLFRAQRPAPQAGLDHGTGHGARSHRPVTLAGGEHVRVQRDDLAITHPVVGNRPRLGAPVGGEQRPGREFLGKFASKSQRYLIDLPRRGVEFHRHQEVFGLELGGSGQWLAQQDAHTGDGAALGREPTLMRQPLRQPVLELRVGEPVDVRFGHGCIAAPAPASVFTE